MSKNRLSNALIYLSVAALVLPFFLQVIIPSTPPPEFFGRSYGNWLSFPVIFWCSNLLVVLAIIVRLVRKEKPFKFLWVYLVFFAGAFMGFSALDSIYPFIAFMGLSYLVKEIEKRRIEEAKLTGL